MESEDHIDGEAALPFDDKIDLEVFYDGPGRGEILAQLREAVEGGAPLIVLSGSEGSGKTAICRMLERHCHGKLPVVFFAKTVESFEDVVRRIIAALEISLPDSEESRGVDHAVEEIVAFLSRDGRGVLLIFDEAEDIYLATLERVRKMLDRVTAAGAGMQILFSGRKTFLENCEQLSICDFRTSDGLHIDLAPLSEEQSAAYLRSIAAKTLPPEKQRVFNDEVARNIHELAKGRPRRLNLLARESLRAPDNDPSFMTLLDSVQEEFSSEEVGKKPVRRLARGKMSLRWVIGAGVLAIAGVLLLRPTGEVKVREQVAVKAMATIAEPVVSAEGQRSDGREVVANRPEETASPLPAEPAAAPPEQHLEPPKEAEKPASATIGTASSPQTVTEASSGRVAAVVESSPAEPAPAAVPPSPAPPETEKVDKQPLKEKVVVLKAVPPIKVRPSSQKEEPGQSAKAAAKKEAADPTANLTVDQLYKKRLQAGSTWLSAEKKSKFTVQLMVLTAKNAGSNFKKMLSQPSYRQEAGNFYIFEKSGSPEVVWVFYGEYPSLELARLAQNSLPPFLREHHPYAIAIKGALAKVLAK